MRVLMLTRGGGDFGMGHCYRTRVLARALLEQALISQIAVSADTSLPTDWFDDVTLLPPPAELPREALVSANLVVVDWLDSDTARVADLRRYGRVVLLDDYGPAADQADLTINALLGPLNAEERRTSHGRVLGGVPYIQLSPRVTRLRSVAAATARAMQTELAAPLETGPVHGVLVSLGAATTEAGMPYTDMALETLARTGFTGRVIVMPAVPGLIVPSSLNAELLPRGDALPDLLAASDLVICHDGLTLYEAAHLGVPAVTLPLWPTGAKLAAAGTCLVADADGTGGSSLNDALRRVLGDAQLRSRMTSAGMRLVDGRGLERTVAAIGDLLR